MKGKLSTILAMVLCMVMAGCKAGHPMKSITQVTYTSDSGTILPELQWHEQFDITREGVVLTRNGRTPDTEVNAGTWEITVEEDAVAALFAQLEGANPTRIKRVEPEDPPDGGGTEEYAVAYGRDKTLTMRLDPGVTYTGGDSIVAPVQAFLRDLTLPPEAATRYAFTAP
ncbi:MAG: hypothetical protein MUF84_19005 [Anaerolineae bacterium]|nr:hypothetical protein [Anaerolineae bacterium]